MKCWSKNTKFSLEVDHVHKHALEFTYLGVDSTNMLTVQNFNFFLTKYKYAYGTEF